jgi:hypothetical protein
MDATPYESELAADLLGRCAAVPFRHGDRPCLALSIPHGDAHDVSAHFVICTEPDGSLGGRRFVSVPDAGVARFRNEASMPSRGPGPGFVAFSDGLPDLPGGRRTLASAIRRTARASGLPGDGLDAVAARAAALVATALSARVDAALEASGIDPSHVAALRALRRFLRPPKAVVEAVLGPASPSRAAAIAACESMPLLCELLLAQGPDPAAVLARGPDGLRRACLDLAGPGFPEDRLDRIGRLGRADFPHSASGGAAAFLRLLADAPRDWVRPVPEAIGPMLALSGAYANLVMHRGADPAALLGPARGNWAAFHARCAAAAGPVLEREAEATARVAESASDVLVHFAERVLLPLLARSDPPADGFPEPWLIPCLVAARRILFADKGMPAVLAATALWHERAERIEARIPSGDKAEWEAPCPPFRTSEGLLVRPLASAMELVAEGAAGADADGIPGLGHCVASYRTIAQTGRSHILSVRAADGLRRLSTAEIKVDGFGRARVVQHKGHGNAPPPPEAVRAMGEFVTGVRLAPPEPDASAPATGRIAAKCGYDWRNDDLVRLAVLAYAEFLPRDLRDGDLDRLAERAGFAAREPDAAPDSSHRP